VEYFWTSWELKQKWSPIWVPTQPIKGGAIEQDQPVGGVEASKPQNEAVLLRQDFLLAILQY